MYIVQLLLKVVFHFKQYMNKTKFFQISILWIPVLTIFLLPSCKKEEAKESKPQYDNVRVIELDPVINSTESKELSAVTDELSKYDCDLNWVLFDFNSAEINLDGKVELQKIANILKENNKFKARLRAFTDSRGSDEFNKKLSDKRALAARDYLLRLGVNPDKIKAASFSEASPIAINTEDDTGRRFNRRIELFILDELGNTVCRSHAPKVPGSLKAN